MLPLGSVAAKLVCGSLADLAPAHALSVQPMDRYLSPISLSQSLIPHVPVDSSSFIPGNSRP